MTQWRDPKTAPDQWMEVMLKLKDGSIRQGIRANYYIWYWHVARPHSPYGNRGDSIIGCDVENANIVGWIPLSEAQGLLA